MIGTNRDDLLAEALRERDEALDLSERLRECASMAERVMLREISGAAAERDKALARCARLEAMAPVEINCGCEGGGEFVADECTEDRCKHSQRKGDTCPVIRYCECIHGVMVERDALKAEVLRLGDAGIESWAKLVGELATVKVERDELLSDMENVTHTADESREEAIAIKEGARVTAERDHASIVELTAEVERLKVYERCHDQRLSDPTCGNCGSP